uniref:Iron-containing redox enzyme family protein n=1 Tax=Tetraselmis sp. GSL018 TaxID=582737 RepID=A0A061RDK2_9CHLO
MSRALSTGLTGFVRPCAARPQGRSFPAVSGRPRGGYALAALAPVTPDPTAVEGRRVTIHHKTTYAGGSSLPELVNRETLRELEAELDRSESVSALRRFNTLLAGLDESSWRTKLRPVLRELAYNLESFNPLFTAVLLKVQCGIGETDYVRRDNALKNLIQPLAGEYGMHNGEPQAKTHRELFSEFYESLMGEPLEELMREDPAPELSRKAFQAMLGDVMSAGGKASCVVEQGSYALGYNLAIEYLADYEKTWMLDAFRELHGRVMNKELSWTFLEIHAEGEAEHAAIGHAAVENLVPSSHVGLLRQAMRDHDRDFAAFYNALADMLE